MKNRKKLAVYAATAAATATMSLTAAIPASASVRMFVVNGAIGGNGNGNYNGNMNGTYFGGAGQNMDLSDVLSSLCPNLPSSVPSGGNLTWEMDGCFYPGQPNLSGSGQNNWWNCPNQNQPSQNFPGQNCPDQNQPDFNYPGQNCPDQNQPDFNYPGQNCPDQNQPDQNYPGLDCPDQNQPEQDQPNQPINPNPNPPSQGGSTNTSYAQQVIDLVNEERAKAGLAPVSSVDSITEAANVRAREIVTNFSHTRPDGSSFSTALRQAGVSYMGSGENIAYGQRNPKEVMDGWMNSSGHRANILNSNYKNIGIGYYESNGVKYWVQLFTY